MNKSKSRKKSQFRRKFLFILSLFFVLLVFLLGVEVGQRFSRVPLKGLKKAGGKRYLTEKGKNGVEINEALDSSPEEDVPEPKITFYDSLKDKTNDKNTSVDKPNHYEGESSPKGEAKKKENSLPGSGDPNLKQQPSKYALQLGSYKNRSQAEELEKEFKEKGYSAYVIEAHIPDKGTWYRVKIGDYDDLEQVKQVAAELQQREGVSVVITNASQ
jgi:cell division septation protein DedD